MNPKAQGRCHHPSVDYSCPSPRPFRVTALFDLSESDFCIVVVDSLGFDQMRRLVSLNDICQDDVTVVKWIYANGVYGHTRLDACETGILAALKTGRPLRKLCAEKPLIWAVRA